MRSLSIVVLGGGIAGLCAALALARAGHRVTLVERDDVAVGEPLDAVDWDRRSTRRRSDDRRGWVQADPRGISGPGCED